MNYNIDFLANKPEFLSEVPTLWTTQWPRSYPKETVFEDTKQMLNINCAPLVLIAHESDKLIGTIALTLKLIKSRPELTPCIGRVFVKSSYRHHNVATHLLARVQEEAKRLKYKKIYLHTEKSQKLYEKSGWKFLEHTTDDIGDPTDIYYLDIL